MKKKLLEYLLVMLVLSPLLLLNIRNSHDWGDDFAGYITQARNIAEGKPFYKTKFEFHDYNPSYAPPYYSYGFPLLLSPVIKHYGLNFHALNRYMSLWVWAWGLLVFIYLRGRFSLFTSLSFTLLFFLNPFSLGLKPVSYQMFRSLSSLVYPCYYIFIDMASRSIITCSQV